jgi:hypothetical protein
MYQKDYILCMIEMLKEDAFNAEAELGLAQRSMGKMLV